MSRHLQTPTVRLACLLLLLAGFAAGVPSSRAQQTKLTNFRRTSPYDPPNDNQIKSEVRGGSAKAIGTNLFELNDLRVNTWKETGEPQMYLESPQCVYDQFRQQTKSDGPLNARSEDGRFYIQGTGFFWEQNNSRLQIFHNVHSVLQSQLATNAVTTNKSVTQSNVSTNSFGRTNAAGLTNTLVDSRAFDYNWKSHVAIYSQDVRVDDPKMKLTCELLTANLPESGGRIDRIVAETNVVIDSDENGEKTHAVGAKAIYTYKIVAATTNEVLELSGNPRMEREASSLIADLIVVDRGVGKIRGAGHQHTIFKSRSDKPGETNLLVVTDVYSDDLDYDSKTGIAIYTGNVRVSDPRLNLTCGKLTVALPPRGEKGGHPNHMLAEDAVVIDAEHNGEITHATGTKAVYDYKVEAGKTNELMELSGNPALARPAGSLHGDTIILDRGNGIILANGNQHSVFKSTNSASPFAAPAKTNAAPAAPTDIFSERMSYDQTKGVAIYAGAVRVLDPRIKLTCPLLTTHFSREPGMTNQVERSVAKGGVIMDLMDDKGRSSHGTCEMAVYTSKVVGGVTNQIVTMTGNPFLEQPGPSPSMTTADVIIVNRLTGELRSVGNSYSSLMAHKADAPNSPAAKPAKTPKRLD